MLKKFIDDQGTFEIKVPFTWKYTLQDAKVHTFQEYEIWKSNAFQLSINTFQDQTHKANFISQTKNLKTLDLNGVIYYKYPANITDKVFVQAWTTIINDLRVLFTYTQPNIVDVELDSRSSEEKENTIFECIKTFKLINNTDRSSKLNSYRFDMFLQGVGATALILSKAIENKSFIEATCILANQIDALLRIGIVLKNQTVNNNAEIELEWIYQGLTDKKKIEKEVYKKAKDLGIIEESLFNELYKLYDDRNRVIHRFIISEITFAEVEEISYKYYKVRQKVNTIIYDIEEEQIRLNIGMTRKSWDKETTDNLDYIKGKIGKQNYFEDMNITY